MSPPFKILNLQAAPGERGLLPYICKSLGLDFDEVLVLLRKDRIELKGWASALPKANKTIQETATLMESLKPKDQEEILKFVKLKAGLL